MIEIIAGSLLVALVATFNASEVQKVRAGHKAALMHEWEMRDILGTRFLPPAADTGHVCGGDDCPN